MPDAVISASNLCVDVKTKKILKNVSFNANRGEVLALLGGNGAGKSTTIKTFLGLMKPTSGSVRLDGVDVKKDPGIVRQKVAYLPESVMLYGHLTAIENIQYFLSLSGKDKSETEIVAALQRVALQESAWRTALGGYSKSMRQKTAIALALLREAPILFLDEPTSGLDPVAIDEFNRLVSRLAAQGATILMVTDDVYGACHVANRIGLLRDGEIVGMFDAPEQGNIDSEAVHKAFTQGVVA
ncbi:MAG: ABC transporter ATP-binding protein [Pseudomonadota bacterium]|nr:ABC transporter ATP-binding protein [Alteromonas sp.]MDY6926442.1 ABC transporter ATP-binding protein [Pseudomonadota bacterium]RPH15255.1 MAG: ABC transporter ATP-binding protein [Alteromonadaceae bacterium TMED7]|tara:strand:+ start:1778 stop:2500 length:723 start_codon:yes stop_codon:yes gene_type:complete